MAFSLEQARGKSYPLPWAPQIRHKYWSIICIRLIVLFALWVSAAGVCAWSGSSWALGLFPAWLITQMNDNWWAVISLMAAPLFIPLALGSTVKTPLIRTFGYGRASTNTVSGRHSKPPVSLSRTALAVACTGAAGGVVTGTVIAFAQVISAGNYENVRLALLASVTAASAGLLTWAGVRASRKAIAGWQEEVDRERIASYLLAHGTHVIGRVTEARFKKSWLDQQPVFTLNVEYQIADKAKKISFHYVDYPRWAPVVGNEFDIWFDPDHPDDPRRILLERKIVGQNFASDIEHLRRPSSGSDGPEIGPIEPEWAQTESQNKPLATARIAVHLIFAILFAAGATAALIAWAAEFGTKPWWMLPCLLLFVAAFSLDTVCWVSILNRSQWLVRTTWTTGYFGWFGFVLMFPIILGMVWMLATVWIEASTFQNKLFMFIGLVAVSGGIFGPISASNMEEAVPRVFGAGTTPPADEVHEALRSSNPAALAALEERYGYITGPLHTRR